MADDEKQTDQKEEAKPTNKKLTEIIESIKGLTALELADLVKALESTFGVSAAAVTVAGTTPAAAAEGEGEQEEQTTFNVILASGGSNKIAVIKAVRELVPTLGLKEAKDLVEAAPKEILTGVNKAVGEEAKTKLTAAGAQVELK